MKRIVIELHGFSSELDRLIASGKLVIEDFEDFKWNLVNDPQKGDVIPGLNGLRKTRLKSSTKGKRGGFRIDYLDIPQLEIIHLIVIYSKNIKEDLSNDEKRFIIKLIRTLKEEAKQYGKNV